MKLTYLILRQLTILGIVLGNLMIPTVLNFDPNQYVFLYPFWCIGCVFAFVKIFPLELDKKG